MNKPKHTPGRWYYDEETQTVRAPAVIGEGHWFTVATCDRKKDNCDANARLIAAAPLLLEALIDLIKLCDSGGMDMGKYDRACTAIEEATK